MVFPTLGAAGGAGPAPGRGWVRSPGSARPRPGLGGAASFGENLRGLHRKQQPPVLKLLPRGEIGWKHPPRPRSPPPPRPRRCRPPSFGAAQSFGINEKSLRKGRRGASSPPTSAPPLHRLISPHSCRFSPLPARPRPDPPSPGNGGRQRRAERGGGGRSRWGPRSVPLPKRPRGRFYRKKEIFHRGRI